MAPVPHKSKSGPQQGQKPLTRIRAQGKMRRSDPNSKDPTTKDSADIKQQKESIDHLNVSTVIKLHNNDLFLYLSVTALNSQILEIV